MTGAGNRAGRFCRRRRRHDARTGANVDGMSIRFAGCFSEIIAPVICEIDRFYWLIDSPAGIVDSNYMDNPDIYQDMLVQSRALSKADLSMPLIKPYHVDVFSSIFKGGEWSLWIGLDADGNDEALFKAQAVDKPKRYSPDFFDIVSRLEMLLILLIAGDRWEVYCSNESILAKFGNEFNARPIDSQEEGIGGYCWKS